MDGKRWMVSIDIVSPDVSLDRLRELIATDPAPGSRSVGAIDHRGRASAKTVFRIASQLGETAPLAAHLADIFCRVDHTVLIDARSVLPADTIMSLNVGIMYDTVTCSFSLRPDEIQLLSKMAAGLDVTCYPSQINCHTD
jgi:hypothetical protein